MSEMTGQRRRFSRDPVSAGRARRGGEHRVDLALDLSAIKRAALG
jgi:hypothetical protein